MRLVDNIDSSKIYPSFCAHAGSKNFAGDNHLGCQGYMVVGGSLVGLKPSGIEDIDYHMFVSALNYIEDTCGKIYDMKNRPITQTVIWALLGEFGDLDELIANDRFEETTLSSEEVAAVRGALKAAKDGYDGKRTIKDVVYLVCEEHNITNHPDMTWKELFMYCQPQILPLYGYHYDPAFFDTTVHIKKSVQGDAPSEWEADFDLYEADVVDGIVEEGKLVETKRLDSESPYKDFTLGSFYDTGDYYYIIKEKSSDSDCRVNRQYLVKVIVSSEAVDSQDDKYLMTMHADIEYKYATSLDGDEWIWDDSYQEYLSNSTKLTTPLHFINTYPINSSFDIGKVVNDEAPATWDFDFAIYDADENGEKSSQEPIATTNLSNEVTTYTQEVGPFDSVGTSYYLVEETGKSGNGWTIPGTQYLVRVTIDEGDNGLFSTISYKSRASEDIAWYQDENSWIDYTGDPLTFSNIYEENIITPVETVFSATKLIIGVGEPEAWGPFNFVVYTSDEFGSEDAIVSAKEVSNLNPTVDFDPIQLENAGDYYYLVKEIGGSSIEWEFDSHEYLIHVPVVSDAHGQLTVGERQYKVRTDPSDGWSAWKSYNGGIGSDTDISFTNIYTAGFVFPSVGGIGTGPFHVIGAMIMVIISVLFTGKLIYTQYKRRRYLHMLE